MWKRYAIFALILIPAILLQSSLFTISVWQGKINIILLLLVACTLFCSLEEGVFSLIISGYLLDLYAQTNFGLILISLFIAVTFVYFIANNFINHDSWWSVVLLMIIGEVIYNGIMLVCTFGLWRLNLSVFYINFSMMNLISQISINVLIILFVYLFCSFFVKYLIVYGKKE